MIEKNVTSKSRAIRLLVFVLLSALWVDRLRAELPDVTTAELADQIELHENRIQAFQVKYRLTHGDYSEKGDLSVNMIIECEYAHDIGKGYRYLHEKWVKEDLERKYAYDGKTGTTLSLKLPGDPGRMYGRIMPNPPEDLVDQAIWKPDFWSGYGFIEESDTLSSAIRNAGKVEVTTEQSDGEQLYKVTFVATGGKKIKIVDPAGRTRWIDMGDTYVAWVSPRKSFRPVKIARLRGWGGDVITSCRASDFRQISPGVWLPYRLERSNVTRKSGRLIEIDTIAINEKASVVGRLKFPPGTYMKNEKWGVEYQAGRGLSRVRLETVTKTLILYLILGILFISTIVICIYYGYKYVIRKNKRSRGYPRTLTLRQQCHRCVYYASRIHR